jgi:hypothetical protein
MQIKITIKCYFTKSTKMARSEGQVIFPFEDVEISEHIH